MRTLLGSDQLFFAFYYFRCLDMMEIIPETLAYFYLNVTAEYSDNEF